jgi:hypothetical protein
MPHLEPQCGTVTDAKPSGQSFSNEKFNEIKHLGKLVRALSEIAQKQLKNNDLRD